ncbi:MAG: hypothetical protein M3495_03210, partial [Pseudomonadota bacterium]|nr:hypothetical protein [Pseudomonadota bacterium]
IQSSGSFDPYRLMHSGARSTIRPAATAIGPADRQGRRRRLPWPAERLVLVAIERCCAWGLSIPSIYAMLPLPHVGRDTGSVHLGTVLHYCGVPHSL